MSVALKGIEHADVMPQPDEWPADPSELPGELIGSYASGRAASEVGSWQSTRTHITNAKAGK